MKQFFFTALLMATPSLFAAGADTTATALIARGDALDAAMKTTEALEVYLEAEAADPENAELLIKIAKQYGESMIDIADKAGQRAAGQSALTYSQRAAGLAPTLADAHLAVAICYGRLLSLVPAKTRVEYSRRIKSSTEKAIRLDPKSDYAWHLLGRWHREVATTGPLLRGLVKVVYGGLPDASLKEAIAAFEKAAALEPDRLCHPIELGITYAKAGEKEKARSAIKRGLALPARERDDPDTKARGREMLASLDN